MKIAIPEHQGRVSPVMDTSLRLLVFEVGEDREPECHAHDWSSVPPAARAAWLRERRVDAVVCGGISAWLAAQVQAQGIQLIPWVAGEVGQVLTAYAVGRLPDTDLAMPGCRGRRRGGRGSAKADPSQPPENRYMPQDDGAGPAGCDFGRGMGRGGGQGRGRRQGQRGGRGKGRSRP